MPKPFKTIITLFLALIFLSSLSIVKAANDSGGDSGGVGSSSSSSDSSGSSSDSSSSDSSSSYCDSSISSISNLTVSETDSTEGESDTILISFNLNNANPDTIINIPQLGGAYQYTFAQLLEQGLCDESGSCHLFVSKQDYLDYSSPDIVVNTDDGFDPTLFACRETNQTCGSTQPCCADLSCVRGYCTQLEEENKCAEGSTKCENNRIYTCNDQGVYISTKRCDFGCDNSEGQSKCKVSSVTRENTMCLDGKYYLTVSEDGTAQTKTLCPYKCSLDMGGCYEPQPSPTPNPDSPYQCKGNILVDKTKPNLPIEECPYGCNSNLGKCNPKPTNLECSNEGATRCSSDTGYSYSQICQGGQWMNQQFCQAGCSGGKCKEVVEVIEEVIQDKLIMGQQVCKDDEVAVHFPDGMGGTSKLCIKKEEEAEAIAVRDQMSTLTAAAGIAEISTILALPTLAEAAPIIGNAALTGGPVGALTAAMLYFQNYIASLPPDAQMALSVGSTLSEIVETARGLNFMSKDPTNPEAAGVAAGVPMGLYGYLTDELVDLNNIFSERVDDYLIGGQRLYDLSSSTTNTNGGIFGRVNDYFNRQIEDLEDILNPEHVGFGVDTENVNNTLQKNTYYMDELDELEKEKILDKVMYKEAAILPDGRIIEADEDSIILFRGFRDEEDPMDQIAGGLRGGLFTEQELKELPASKIEELYYLREGMKISSFGEENILKYRELEGKFKNEQIKAYQLISGGMKRSSYLSLTYSSRIASGFGSRVGIYQVPKDKVVHVRKLAEPILHPRSRTFLYSRNIKIPEWNTPNSSWTEAELAVEFGVIQAGAEVIDVYPKSFFREGIVQ